MTEDEMELLIKHGTLDIYWWECPMCSLESDDERYYIDALEDLRYHINEDHKGEH